MEGYILLTCIHMRTYVHAYIPGFQSQESAEASCQCFGRIGSRSMSQQGATGCWTLPPAKCIFKYVCM